MKHKGQPTKAQLRSILVKYERNPDGAESYREFRKRFYVDPRMGCMLGQWCGMTLGIEPDGHAHT